MLLMRAENNCTVELEGIISSNIWTVKNLYRIVIAACSCSGTSTQSSLKAAFADNE